MKILSIFYYKIHMVSAFLGGGVVITYLRLTYIKVQVLLKRNKRGKQTGQRMLGNEWEDVTHAFQVLPSGRRLNKNK